MPDCATRARLNEIFHPWNLKLYKQMVQEDTPSEEPHFAPFDAILCGGHGKLDGDVLPATLTSPEHLPMPSPNAMPSPAATD